MNTVFNFFAQDEASSQSSLSARLGGCDDGGYAFGPAVAFSDFRVRI